MRPEHRRRGVASASTASTERQARERGCNRWRLQVSAGNEGAQALCRRSRQVDYGVPPRRVKGTILIQTGSIEVDDTSLTWEKHVDQGP